MIEIDESLPSDERFMIAFFSINNLILGDNSFLGRLETGEMVSVDRSFLLLSSYPNLSMLLDCFLLKRFLGDFLAFKVRFVVSKPFLSHRLQFNLMHYFNGLLFYKSTEELRLAVARVI